MAQEMKHASKEQYEEMMRRRRTTIMVAIFVLILIVALIIKAVVGDNEKKEDPDSSKTTVSQTEESTTGKVNTETTTIKKTGPPDVEFDVDAAYTENHKYCVAVNTKTNVVTVYGKDSDGKYTDPVKAFVCSCGKTGGNETPTGTFYTSDRVEWLHMVDGSEGQYTTRINGAIWFHSVCYFTKDKSDLEYEEYNKLGTNASLGCVRLCVADAKWIYENLDWKTCVVIFESDSEGPLGKPTPIKIDVNDKEKRGWDPTDPDPKNPWNA